MINWKLIFKIIGSLLLLEAGFMSSCLLVSLFKDGHDIWPFLFSLLITGGVGFYLKYLGREASIYMSRRDSYAVVTFTWVAFSIFGCLPYIFSGILVNPTDAFFETMSGFTTTGASVLNDVESQLASHHAILFWRSLSQWIGGLGIVFFTIAILPKMVGGTIRVFSAEATGPVRAKMHPRLTTTAKWIWTIYMLLTVGCCGSYMLAGMDWFSAINYAMTTTATGGFSIHNDSIVHFHSAAIEYITLIFQFLSGVNFSVLFATFFKGQLKSMLRNSELRFYISTVAIASLIIAVLLVMRNGYGLEHAFRSAVFQVVSLMTTTGVFSDHVGTWPHFTWVILGILMFTGACAGSTSGGFKSVRGLMLIKVVRNELRRCLHPRAVLPVKINSHATSTAGIQNLLAFFTLSVLLCMLTSAMMTGVGIDFTNGFVIALSLVSNVGLPLNELGPVMSWAELPWAMKWICSLIMLMGRLEIISVLVLFTKSYWKDN